jgi:hypothetical protein
MKTERKYMHIEIGDIDTRSGWESRYLAEELAERRLTAAEAFDQDDGLTFVEVSRVVEVSGGFHSARPIKLRLARYWSQEALDASITESYLSPGQMRRLETHLCGLSDCCCGKFGKIKLVMGEGK